MKHLALILSLLASPAMASGYCTPTSDGKARIPKVHGKTCPTGYFSSSDDCCEAFHRDTPNAFEKIPGQACTSGTYSSGGHCVSFH